MKLVLILLSWGWIFLGAWWFFRPAGIKRRFEKKYQKGARWMILSVLVASAGILFTCGRQIGGVWGTVLAILAVIAVLKALLFVRGKVSQNVLNWWSAQPTWVYRMAAAGLFVLGCLMQWVLRGG